MILVDANILLYAIDRSSPRHEAARGWLERSLSGADEIGFPLVSLLAFVRIGTDPRVFTVPLDPGDAIDIVTGWLVRPNARLVHPTPSHWSALARASADGRARGPGITDAHLAALAAEHGAELCTTDRAFARFEGLRTIDPTT